MVNGPGAGQIEQTVPFQATAPRQARPVGRWSLAGTGGVSFTASTGGFVAGNLDYALTPGLSVSGEVGYLTSALSETTRTHVESMARQTELVLALVTGRTLEVTPSIAVPTLAFTAGARVVGPESGRARPYATVGLGVARLAPTVRLLAGTDDVTGAFVRVEDLPASETGPLVTAGGGMLVRVVEGVAVDIGYRFTRISSGGGLNLNRLAFGVGYRF
jgi:opacity protein-like surface antigen